MYKYAIRWLCAVALLVSGGTLGKQHELGRKVGDTTSTFLHSTVCVKLPASARVVKLVDTRDLKSLDRNRSCRFDSGPGHKNQAFRC